MTHNEADDEKADVQEPDWESIARTQLGRRIQREADELSIAAKGVGYAIEHGNLTADDIDTYRNHREEVAYSIEEEATKLLPDVDPFDGLTLPRSTGDLCDELDITVDELNAIRDTRGDGDTIELDRFDLDNLQDGDPVTVITDTGHRLTLVPEDTEGEADA